MNTLETRYKYFRVKYEDGREDAFKVDVFYARGTSSAIFGGDAVAAVRITEKECLEIWGEE